MADAIQSPAQATFWFIQGRVLFWIINLVGTACFAYIVARRMAPLVRGQRDIRFDRPLIRLGRLLQFWFGQWRHPRYLAAGIIHIFLFAGFIVLVIHTVALLALGTSDRPAMTGGLYGAISDYAATVVFLCMIVAIARRLLKPTRYAVPARYGKAHTADAIFLLALIAILMVADSVFEAGYAASLWQHHLPVEPLAVMSLPWMLQGALVAAPLPVLADLYLGAYLVHELTFFFLLCYRPFGIQFHVETSLFSTNNWIK
jgi:hypothetical protein